MLIDEIITIIQSMDEERKKKLDEFITRNLGNFYLVYLINQIHEDEKGDEE